MNDKWMPEDNTDDASLPDRRHNKFRKDKDYRKKRDKPWRDRKRNRRDEEWS